MNTAHQWMTIRCQQYGPINMPVGRSREWVQNQICKIIHNLFFCCCCYKTTERAVFECFRFLPSPQQQIQKNILKVPRVRWKWDFDATRISIWKLWELLPMIPIISCLSEALISLSNFISDFHLHLYRFVVCHVWVGASSHPKPGKSASLIDLCARYISGNNSYQSWTIHFHFLNATKQTLPRGSPFRW